MIRSLKAQILLVLTILILTLIVQVVQSRISQNRLEQNQQTLNSTQQDLIFVRTLERDVIDLQRHLLIYKETASETSIVRFNELMLNVENKIDEFHLNKNSRLYLNEDDQIMERMRGHLSDYKENFVNVISGRTRREDILNNKIITNFEILDSLMQNGSTHIPNLSKRELSTLKFHVSKAKNYLYQYFLFPELDNVEQFNKQFTIAKSMIQDIKMLLILSEIKQDFTALTHIARGYVFLVNVVMAGSANEFLYLTKDLSSRVSSARLLIIEETELVIADIEAKNNLISAICIVISIGMAWLLFRRIILPIRDITRVFTRLSQGRDIDSIPNTNRKDEIGDLARSAEVFHDKNKLTQQLLEQSQDMIAHQEVLNHQLSLQKDKAEHAAKSKSIFLANMSHEIRTPMNGIIGLVDLALHTELNEIQRNYLNKAAYSGKIMMNVINDILDFSKMEAGKMTIEAVEFDVDSLIENLISSLNINCNEKGLDFRINCSQNVPKKLVGDPLRISQILLNICNNAIKFTDRGFVYLSIDYRAQDAIVQFTIEDSGMGMDESKISSIFDSFTQADDSTSRKFGGTGLGLAIVKQLSLLMQGSVKVTSKLSLGSIFVVELTLPRVGQKPLLSQISPQVMLPPIYYLTEQERPFINEDNFLAMGIEYKQISLSEIKNRLTNLESTSVVVVEIFKEDVFNEYQYVLNQLSLFKIKFACILPSNVADELLRKVNDISPYVLRSPCTSKQLYDFFSRVFNILRQSDERHLLPEKSQSFVGNVLLVEDNPINQLVAGEMLTSLGLTFDLAENGQQALDIIFEKSHYDIILMDVQMPIMDGYEATRRIRGAGLIELVICGLSANAMKEDLDLAQQAGMTDYLTKPLQLVSLRKMLRKYL